MMETMTTEQFRAMIAKPTRRKATKPCKKSAENEDNLQKRVAKFIADNYPDVLFDGNSKNIKLEAWRGAQMKAMGKRKGYPDVFIARARRGYHGMYLELKKEGEEVRKQDGDFYKDEHIQTQAEVHRQLREEGYWADFVIGYEAAKTIIKWYLSES